MLNRSICQDFDNNYYFESNLDKFLTEVSKEFIDNVSLCKNIESLYTTIRRNAKQLEVSDLNESAIATHIELKDVQSVCSIENGIISISASAKLESSILLENNANYSLSLVLYDGNSTYCLIKNPITYEGLDVDLKLNGDFDLTSFKLKTKDVRYGNYINLVCGLVLTKEGQLNDIICSKYSNLTFTSILISDFTDIINGFECSYHPYLDNGLFMIQVEFYDIEDPIVLIKNMSNGVLNLETGAKVYDLLSLIEVSDNDVISEIKILHDETEYDTLKDVIVAGNNKIQIADRSGNQSVLNFDVVLG